MSLPLLEAVQAYRDGHGVTALGWAGNGEAPEVAAYPLFRLYARTIRDVARLEEDLRADGIVVVSHAAEIASALNLERNLMTVLLFIVALAILGFVLAVAANALAAVERKRRSMAVLRLIGYGSAWLVALPVLQAAILALGGVGLAALGFAGVAAIVNATFADSLRLGEAACRLSALQLLAAAASTTAVATLPAVLGGLAAARVQPSLEFVCAMSRHSLAGLAMALVHSAASVAAEPVPWPETLFNPKPAPKISCCQCRAAAPWPFVASTSREARSTTVGSTRRPRSAIRRGSKTPAATMSPEVSRAARRRPSGFYIGKYEVTELQVASLGQTCPTASPEGRLPKVTSPGRRRSHSPPNGASGW